MAKKAYIGAPLTEVVTSNNIGSWFTFSDPDGISSWNGSTITVTGTYSNERVKFTALRDMTVSFDYVTDSFCKISLNGQYICEEGDDGHYTGTLAAGKYFYFSNSSAVSSQTCTFTNITCTTKTSVAHKIKKGYVGIEGIARKIKKGYIGIGGVARPFWSGGELAPYGLITPLSVALESHAGASIENYALFGGGESPSVSYETTVNAYDKSLVRSIPTALSCGMQNNAATNINGHALFGGGRSGSTYSAVVNSYDNSLTRTVRTSMAQARYLLAATATDAYALFAGGSQGSSSYYSTVDAYNPSLTRSTPTALSVARSHLSGASNTNYHVFACGTNRNTSNIGTIDFYNKSLTRTTGTMTTGQYSGGASGKDYAAIIDNSNSVHFFDNSLTKTTVKYSDLAKTWLGRMNGVSLGDYYIFCGYGQTNYNNNMGYALLFDKSLTLKVMSSAYEYRVGGACAKVGDYAIFTGGDNYGNAEAFTI